MKNVLANLARVATVIAYVMLMVILAENAKSEFDRNGIIIFSMFGFLAVIIIVLDYIPNGVRQDNE